MSVPEFVPANVPAPETANDGTSGAKAASYLTGGLSGWRFQMRLPADLIGGDFRLAGVAPIVRASLGPRRRGEAKRLAQQLATLCQAICAAAVAGKDDTMAQQSLSDDQTNLVTALAGENGLFEQVLASLDTNTVVVNFDHADRWMKGPQRVSDRRKDVHFRTRSHRMVVDVLFNPPASTVRSAIGRPCLASLGPV